MLWYPYTQMKTMRDVPELADAKGVRMHLTDGNVLIDGIASWWSAVHGYNHPELNAAIEAQLGKFAHVMLGGITHAPAVRLAEKLAEITPGDLQHVFFSDSGSVGVEVALKIAIQYWKNKGFTSKNKIVYLRNGYHGDTFKAMEASDDSDFNRAFAEVLSPQFALDIPKGGFHASGQEVEEAVGQMEDLFQKHHESIACFILEPIVQCAGGFRIYSPEYLKAARELTQRYDILLIADEVATGLGRTGKTFACEHASITPDILVLGKALTAGYMGHAATVVRGGVFDAFLGDDYEKALMHGPTFMGNALACAVAIKGIELFERDDYPGKIRAIESWMAARMAALSSPYITGKRYLGAIAAIEFDAAVRLSGMARFAQEHGAWLRPIGNVLYLMPAYIITEAEIEELFAVMRKWIELRA